MVYADFAFSVYAWFTQISHGLRMVYADFLGLRKFTRVNLMTQVYNGSPSQGHSGPGPAFVAAAPAVAAHPGPEQHGARRPAVVDVAPAVAAHPGPEPPGAWLAARPSSPPPPPSRRIPGRSRPLPCRPYRSAVAAHPGRLARPGLLMSVA
jgi:hypothetical protein